MRLPEQSKSGNLDAVIGTSRPIRWIVASAAVLIVAIGLGTVVTIVNLRERAVANAERELKNVALMVASQFDRTFETAEQLQSNLIERFAARGALTRDSFEQALSGYDVHLMLKDKIVALPYLGTFTLVNADGKVFNFSRSWPIPAISVADRDFYTALRDNADLTTFISKPIPNRATGTWVVHFARKITGPRKEFIGLLSAVIELSVVEQFFSSIALGPESAIFLVNNGGELLARYPQTPSVIGKRIVDQRELDRVFAKGNLVGRRNGVDEMAKVMAVRTVARYPFIVGASTSLTAALAGWWREATFLGSAGALMILLIAGFTYAIARKLQQGSREVSQTIAKQELQLHTVLDAMLQGLSIFDAKGRLVVRNQRYDELYDVPPGEIEPGCALRDVLIARKAAGTFSGDPDEHAAAMSQTMLRGKVTSRLAELPDGRMIQVVNQPMPDGGWVSTHEDVTEQRRAERERESSRKLLDLVVENVPAAIFLRDARNKRYVLVNRAAETIWEVSRQDLLGKTAADVFPLEDAKKIAARDEELMASPSGGLYFAEHEAHTSKGAKRIFTSRLHMVHGVDTAQKYVLGVIEDVTERKRADERIVHMARHNALTDLPNRVVLRERLDEALKWRQKDQHVAVLCVDINNLKVVNDTMGHATGDKLLKAVARRLRSCASDGHAVAHVGGDEFAVIQPGVAEVNDVTQFAKRVGEWIRVPYDVDGRSIMVTASIGIAVAPNDGTNPEQLLKDADLALHRAKAEGRDDYRFFEAGMDERMQARRMLELDIRTAITNGEFELFYQPLVDAADGHVTGCEALMRWRHPTRGMISPAEFIPVAEETGLIEQLGKWALRRACADAATWPDHMSVAVNLSAVQFKKPTLALTVINALTESGLKPQRLELEVTESVLMQNNEATLATLHQLRDLGVRIAMDDFGTGYSSLSYLRSFPFNKIKIDRSFVADERSDAAVIVHAVADMARNLNMTTTAEGIETEQQREMVRQAGCTEMQGYLFSKPRPLEELRPLFEAAARKAG